MIDLRFGVVIWLLFCAQGCSSPRVSTGSTATSSESEAALAVGVTEQTSGLDETKLGKSGGQPSWLAVWINAAREDGAVQIRERGRFPIQSEVTDSALLRRLDDALKRGMEIEEKSTRVRVWCDGGYEVCTPTRLFLYLLERKDRQSCTGTWFELDGRCP